MIQRVLVTGATGFVGRTLCTVLSDAGFAVRAAVRAPRSVTPANVEKVVVGEVGSGTDWTRALENVDAVIHAAARAHIMDQQSSNVDLYYETNARGTERLAQAAAAAGVSRFIYVSSIKVNGEEQSSGPYTANDSPNPQDPYGLSKLQGEQALLTHAGPMQVAIVRPPLVYGPGVRANFLRLIRWVDKGIPLPLGAVNNQRSLVSIWNLCDLLSHLLRVPLPSQRVWLVSDGEDLATPELIRRIAHAMGRSARLVSVPKGLLMMGGSMLGRGAEMRRLCGSLVADISTTRNELGWSPPLSVDDALQLTVSWYMREGRSRAT